MALTLINASQLKHLRMSLFPKRLGKDVYIVFIYLNCDCRCRLSFAEQLTLVHFLHLLIHIKLTLSSHTSAT